MYAKAAWVMTMRNDTEKHLAARFLERSEFSVIRNIKIRGWSRYRSNNVLSARAGQSRN